MEKPKHIKDIVPKVKDKACKEKDTLADASYFASASASTLLLKKSIKLKMPDATHEAVRESFAITRGRLTQDELQTIPANEIKALYQEQLEFPFAESQDLYLYKRKDKDSEVAYYIPKDIVDKQKPSFPLMKRAYLASLVMAFEQKSPAIQFTLGDKLKQLGYNDKSLKSGKPYHELSLAESGLAGIHFHYKNNKKGKQKVEIIGSFYSLLKKGEGKGARYEAFLNPVFTKNIDFVTGEIKGRYIETALSDTMNRRLSIYQNNIRAKAVTFKDLPFLEVYGETFLSWACVPKSYHRQKRLREKIYTLALEVLKDLGFKKEKISYNHKPKDFRKWKLTFKPPQTEKKPQSRQADPASKDDVQRFIERFAEWQSRDIHYGKSKQKLSYEDIKTQITNCIRGVGFEACKSIFDKVNSMQNPHPKDFWESYRTHKNRLKTGAK